MGTERARPLALEKVIWAESFGEEEQRARSLWDLDIPLSFFRTPLQNIPENEFIPNTGVAIRTHSRLPDTLKQKLVCVLTRSTGFDHIGEEYSNLPVGYLPDYATQAVAEYNLMMALGLLRCLPDSMDAIQRFERSGLTGNELATTEIGIVGVGRIGKATAELLAPQVKSIRGYDVKPDSQWAKSVGLKYVELEALFRQSKIVFLCLPMNSSTEFLIDSALLHCLSNGSYLVNSGRGEVVRNQDLLSALEEGPLGGIALDVYNRESELREYLSEKNSRNSLPEEVHAARKLLEHPRVMATPHNAFNTQESLEKKVKRTLRSLRAFQNTGTFPFPVR